MVVANPLIFRSQTTISALDTRATTRGSLKRHGDCPIRPQSSAGRGHKFWVLFHKSFVENALRLFLGVAAGVVIKTPADLEVAKIHQLVKTNI